jgi:hypothetical protein
MESGEPFIEGLAVSSDGGENEIWGRGSCHR